MKRQYLEKFFIAKPVPTGDVHLYTDGRTMEALKWSADFPVPNVGDKILITMNGIGWAHVVGYFSSETDGGTYLGVMTRATRPPAWLRRQQREYAKDATKPHWYRDGIGCEFGTEIALKRKRKVKVVV